MIQRFFLKLIFIFSIAFLGINLPPYATSPVQHVITSGNWHVYHHKDQKGKDTYALIGYPHKKSAINKERKDTYILITAKKDLAAPLFLTFVAGDQLLEKSVVVFAAEGAMIKFLPQKDKALAPDNATDQKLIHHMIKHKTLTVTSHFKNGQKTKDTYILSGFKKAYEKLMTLIKHPISH